jgi:hypothetical protein
MLQSSQNCPSPHTYLRFTPSRKAIWLIAALANALILITAEAIFWAVLRLSKCAVWLPSLRGGTYSTTGDLEIEVTNFAFALFDLIPPIVLQRCRLNS